MNVFLLRPWLFTRPFELDQKWAATGHPKDSVRVPGVPGCDELRTNDSKMLVDQVTGFLLDITFKLKHNQPMTS